MYPVGHKELFQIQIQYIVSISTFTFIVHTVHFKLTLVKFSVWSFLVTLNMFRSFAVRFVFENFTGVLSVEMRSSQTEAATSLLLITFINNI